MVVLVVLCMLVVILTFLFGFVAVCLFSFGLSGFGLLGLGPFNVTLGVGLVRTWFDC